MGFLSDGAGERTARTHHDGVQANEATRQQNRFDAQDRDLAHRTAMTNYTHALSQLRDWEASNRAWQLKEYDRECRAADREEREPRYRTPTTCPTGTADLRFPQNRW